MDSNLKAISFLRNVASAFFLLSLLLLGLSYGTAPSSLYMWYTGTQVGLVYILPLIVPLLLLSIPFKNKLINVPILLLGAIISTYSALSCTDGSCMFDGIQTFIFLSFFLLFKLAMNKIYKSYKVVAPIVLCVSLVILIFASFNLVERNARERAFIYNWGIQLQIADLVKKDKIDINELIKLCSSFKTSTAEPKDVEQWKSICDIAIREIQKDGKISDLMTRIRLGLKYDESELKNLK